MRTEDDNKGHSEKGKLIPEFRALQRFVDFGVWYLVSALPCYLLSPALIMLLPLGSIVPHSACKVPCHRVMLIDDGYKGLLWIVWWMVGVRGLVMMLSIDEMVCQ